MTTQSSLRFFLILTLALGWLANAACQFGKNEYSNVLESELVALVETMPKSQIGNMANNPQMRKQMIDEFKKRFALAQAAIADGVDKSEDFTKSFALTTARLLAQEHSKRNADFQVGKPEIDAYITAHQKEFDSDVAFFNKNSRQAPTPDQMEGLKTSWGELQIRAEKARQAGIEKEPATQLQLKIIRAELLANLYSNKLQKQLEPTDADYKEYYKQNPDTDPEKIKQRMVELLTRIKNGEAFEKIADEVNDDGTKGRGGDLRDENMNWTAKGSWDPDFEKAAFALQPGQITQEPVKSSFGYHLIKVEGRRKIEKKPALPPGAVGNSLNQVAGPNTPDPNAEEIHAKHIYLSTKVAEEALAQKAAEKVKRAMEDATLKYRVNAPEDFKLNVAGMRIPSGTPAPGSGLGGSMKMITPNPGK